MAARLFFILSIVACGYLTAISQGTPAEKDDVIKVDTHIVEVPVVITDKTGKPLLNLKQNNFVVYEDGKQQEILDFSTTNEPFEVALLLDTSGSTRAVFQLIQRAAESFIASLRPGDRVALIAYRQGGRDTNSADVEILANLSASRSELSTALQHVSTSNGTPYYDSLAQITDKVFGDRPQEEFRGRESSCRSD